MKVKERDTARFKIWNDRFLCMIREIDTLSDEYIKYFGTHTTFDPQIDKALYNELTHRYMTIIDMMKYFTQGVVVYIKNPVDSKTIYMLLHEHLESWSNAMLNPMQEKLAPIEELKVMNDFAEVVFLHAKHYLENEFKGTKFERAMKDDRSVLKLLKPKDKSKSDVKDDPKSEILESSRRSMSELFNSKSSDIFKGL